MEPLLIVLIVLFSGAICALAGFWLLTLSRADWQ